MMWNRLLESDKQALLWINAHHPPLLDAILVPVSFVGEYGAIWFIVTIALMVWGRPEHKKTALMMILTMIFVDRCIAAPLGHCFFRTRPYLALHGVRQLGVAWHSSSFPSGHAHSVWTATLILGSRWRKWRIPLVIFAFLTCYSRPYLGMHYPLDVAAGSAIGMTAGGLVLFIERLFKPHKIAGTDG